VDGGGVHPQGELLAGEARAEPELLPADSEVPRWRHHPVDHDRVRGPDQILGSDHHRRGGRRLGVRLDVRSRRGSSSVLDGDEAGR
jgi:hypothetical protein